MSEPDRDQLHLRLIADAISDVQRRLLATSIEEFLKDRDEQALAAFRLLIIGENANKLSDELKSRHPELSWRRMVAFRNIVAHEYHRADPVLVWEAALGLRDIENMVEAELVEPSK
jgi:uncharacterized protein with HEPN domain